VPTVNADDIPSGFVFDESVTENPTGELFNQSFHHPSILGTATHLKQVHKDEWFF
jgi:hypothetical protein